jgi:aminoglycoside phosphotransferase family enzyme/predicted kinase
MAAMLRPSFYPGRPSTVTHLETHISHVFFAGDLVYKVKKPVRFSFLNYSTLRRRRYFLHEELRLNRRLAPSLYLGVLPISYGAGGWTLGSDAEPVEYALVMRRLPERRMLPFLLERGLVTPPMMRALAQTLASFHAAAATGKEITASGRPQAIQEVWAENLADIHPFLGPLLDRETFEAWQDFGQFSLARHGDLFVRRLHEGRVREVHGDLHCEHICFAPEGIQIFDCIEFSGRLRCCDVASEVAFLLMDLELRGADRPAREFLDRYLELTGDLELPALLPFYKCYRALVRGKVETLRCAGISPQASRYFELATRITWEELRPFVILICGLTGSGKSTLARGLSQRLGLPVISSDATRKALAGTQERRDAVLYETGIYSPSMTERTYAKIFEEVEGLISKGQGVIVDATFQRRAHRGALLGLAARHGVPLAVIYCRGSEEVVRERLRRRQEEGRDLSDGRWEVYVRQKASFEPLCEIPSGHCLTLDTEAPATELVHRAERFLLSVLKKRS